MMKIYGIDQFLADVKGVYFVPICFRFHFLILKVIISFHNLAVSLSKMVNRSELKVGQKVAVSPRDKRSSGEVVGILAEILTNSESHPHGILVALKGGITGRVQKILSRSASVEDENGEQGVEGEVAPILEESNNGKQIHVKEPRSLENLVKAGEDQYVEFKTSMLWSVGKSQAWLDSVNSPNVNQYGTQTSVIIIAKVIASFLNSSGGCLLIGVKENKEGDDNEVVGVESEFSKLEDSSFDGYRRFIIDRLLRPHLPSDIFNRLVNYLTISFEELNGKNVCRIDIVPSDLRVFIKIKGRECFYIRVDATTREIYGEQILEYCEKRFKSS